MPETNGKRLKNLKRYFDKYGDNYCLTSVDVEWLIEQAERAQEYKSDAEHLAKAWTDKVEENKKFREALEEISKYDDYYGQEVSMTARQALEGKCYGSKD